MTRCSILLRCDKPEDHLELLDFCDHLRRMAGLIPHVIAPRRWEKLRQLGVQIDVISDDRELAANAADAMVQIALHTRFTCRSIGMEG